MNTCTIIFCNDSPQFAFYNIDADAPEVEAKLEELARAEYERDKFNFPGTSYEDYRRLAYWHTHTVEAQ